MNQREFVQQYIISRMATKGVAYNSLQAARELVHEAIEVWAYIQKETVDEKTG